MEAHSSILAWEIPCREELGGYSPWGCKESDMTEVTEHAFLCAGTTNLYAFLVPTPPSHSILSSQSLYFQDPPVWILATISGVPLNSATELVIFIDGEIKPWRS